MNYGDFQALPRVSETPCFYNIPRVFQGVLPRVAKGDVNPLFLWSSKGLPRVFLPSLYPKGYITAALGAAGGNLRTTSGNEPLAVRSINRFKKFIAFPQQLARWVAKGIFVSATESLSFIGRIGRISTVADQPSMNHPSLTSFRIAVSGGWSQCPPNDRGGVCVVGGYPFTHRNSLLNALKTLLAVCVDKFRSSHSLMAPTGCVVASNLFPALIGSKS
ncbi:hypothetical protein [Aliiroseovarius sp. 2305UL8-7]|uniref:hypothetical protein n=1 Tax=Aliiroseovarius conchicola TaxID=3121637 RepID=UPI003526C9E9